MSFDLKTEVFVVFQKFEYFPNIFKGRGFLACFKGDFQSDRPVLGGMCSVRLRAGFGNSYSRSFLPDCDKTGTGSSPADNGDVAASRRLVWIGVAVHDQVVAILRNI